MPTSRTLMLALVMLVGCGDAAFQCMDDAQCDDGDCEVSGYCSFAAPACSSGRRYGEFAGDGLGGTCVVVGRTDSDASAGFATTAGSFTGPTNATSSTTADTATADASTDPDPVTTTSVSTTPDTDDESSDDGRDTADGPSESSSGGDPSETTGQQNEISVSFGDRFDADHQGVVGGHVAA